jgi:hypothetical protein
MLIEKKAYVITLVSPCLCVPLLQQAGILELEETRGGVVGWGTMLQAGRSRVRIPIRWIFFQFTLSFQPHYGPGVDSASNRNEYQ